MFRAFVKAMILGALALALGLWATVNRQPVTVSFDPFDTANPAAVLTWPFYLVAFAILIAGVVLGGIATWLEQGKARADRNRLEGEVAALRAELQGLKRQAAKSESRALSYVSGPAARRPPAA